MPVLATTRDAIVALLNGAALTPSVPAVAAYESSVALEKFSGARLLVIPREIKGELLTFAGQQDRQAVCDVVLQYKCKTLAVTELDPYLALAESIHETLIGAELTDVSALCTEVTWIDGTWITDHLEKFNVLTIPLSASIELIQ